MKRILMIGTGGTIASEITSDGLLPELSTEQLLNFVPDIAAFCKIDCVQSYNLDSTNICPKHWLKLSELIKKEYDNYDGFVICHGTDTMAYTASALSYLIQGSKKPIVLTGAQKPIWFDGTDSKRNITDAFIYAVNGVGGVQIVFNGEVISGTRARKTYSKSFKAFLSVNYPSLAIIQDGKIFQYIYNECLEKPVFSTTLNEKVGLIKLFPGVDSELLRYTLNKYDAVIIESFGVGGLPQYSNFYEVIDTAIKNGKIIVMTTQVPYEGSDLAVYQIGGKLKNNLPILEAYDMTTEAVLAKMMWIMGKTSNYDEIKKLFYTPIAHDILNCGK